MIRLRPRRLPPQIGFMTVTVALALCVGPALSLLAQRLYDQEEIERLRAEAVDARVRADMAEKGWLCPEDGLTGAFAASLKRGSGVEILRPEVPFELPLATGALAAAPPPPEQTERAAAVLHEELGRYPRSFIEKTRLRRVLVCDDLRERGKPIPSLPNYLSTLVLDVDAPPTYLRRLVHHELYHFVDLADDQEVKNDADWAALNDRWFVYGDGGRFMREPRSGELTDGLPGFLSKYSTSAVEEDKAEVFAFLMVAPERVRAIAERDPIVARKVRTLKERLARLSPELDESFWARQL